MNVSGSKLLFIGNCIRQEIEVAQSKITCNVQVYFLEAMQITDVGMSTIVIRVPFAAIIRQFEFAIHAVHMEIQVDAVIVG